MKKLLNLTILFFAASLILPSCSNDDADEQEPKANHFQVVDQKYLLQEGTLVYIEENSFSKDPETRFTMDLTLHSQGIQVASSVHDQVVFKGIGQQLYFDLKSASKTELNQGVFDLKSDKVTVGMYCENWIDEKHDADQNPWSRLTDGEISISKKGDLYEIILTAIDDQNHNVSAYFKGKLNFYSLDN